MQRGKKWTITFTGSILGGAVPLSSEDHNLCINLCFISNSWKDRTGTNSISYQSPLLLLSWALSNSRYRHTNQKGFGITQGCLGERVSFLPSYHFWSQNDCAWERVKWLDKRSILKPKSFKWKVQNSLHPDSQQIIIKFLGATASPLFLGYVYEPLLISDLSPGLRVLKKKKKKKTPEKGLFASQNSQKIMLLSEMFPPKCYKFWGGCWSMEMELLKMMNHLCPRVTASTSAQLKAGSMGSHLFLCKITAPLCSYKWALKIITWSAWRREGH